MISVKSLSKAINVEYLGNENLIINSISDVLLPKLNSIIFIENIKKFQSLLISAKKTAFLLAKKDQDYVKNLENLSFISNGFLFTKSPRKSFIDLLNFFNPYKKYSLSQQKSFPFLKGNENKDPTWLPNDITLGKNNYIGYGCSYGENVTIGSNNIFMGNNFIGHEVTIGNHVCLHPNVVIYNGTTIEDNVIIHSGAVIGSDGFGYEQTENGQIKVPQIGKVLIKRNVEIGANTTIDRATISSTIIGENTKIDNLVQIAHNVSIGSNCIIVAQSGIAGSTNLGKKVILGGQVGLGDHCNIGDEVIIGPQSGIATGKKIPSKSTLLGSPAYDIKFRIKMEAVFRKMMKNFKK